MNRFNTIQDELEKKIRELARQLSEKEEIIASQITTIVNQSLYIGDLELKCEQMQEQLAELGYTDWD